jgi:hypothetical protein
VSWENHSIKCKYLLSAIWSCERGQHVTGVHAVYSNGFYVSPITIYLVRKIKDTLSYGTPPATIFRCRDKGRMDSEELCEWKCHYISVVKPMPQEKILLNLAGHSSHTQNLAAIEIARKHGVVMPSHSTHRMQLPDVTFSRPLNTYVHGISGQRVSTQYIASLVGMAVPRPATVETGKNRLRNTGLWPVHRFVFTVMISFLPRHRSERTY